MSKIPEARRGKTGRLQPGEAGRLRKLGFAWCSVCRRVLPVESFAVCSDRQNGLQYCCKECRSSRGNRTSFMKQRIFPVSFPSGEVLRVSVLVRPGNTITKKSEDQLKKQSLGWCRGCAQPKPLDEVNAAGRCEQCAREDLCERHEERSFNVEGIGSVRVYYTKSGVLARNERVRLVEVGLGFCPHCQRVRPVSCFDADESSIIGIQGWCSECKLSAPSSQNIRKRALCDSRCQLCGKEFLGPDRVVSHHLDGNGAIHREACLGLGGKSGGYNVNELILSVGCIPDNFVFICNTCHPQIHGRARKLMSAFVRNHGMFEQLHIQAYDELYAEMAETRAENERLQAEEEDLDVAS